MKRFKLTFNHRDWEAGLELLVRLGYAESSSSSESHILDLQDFQREILSGEFYELGLEFNFEFLEFIED